MMASLLRIIRGDLIICFQYNPWVFFPCLIMKVLTGVPMCLLVQDWDLAGYVHSITSPRLYSLNHEIYYRLAERLSIKCELIICSSTFLQRRLGGVRIPQGTDPVPVDPSLRERGRAEMGVAEGDVVVMWVGKPRPYKGLDDLIRAVREASAIDPRVKLAVVGPFEPPGDGDGSLIAVGPVPKEEVLRLVSACDVYAVTPRMTPFSNAQLPTKVFDGMVTERPVVATRVSDLPRLLGKYGVLVDGGEVGELRDAILSLAGDDKSRKKRGLMMRRIFLKNWSTKRMEEKLVPNIGALLPEN
jgi:glycosyltransferase involved in cell wall biosynthesis